MLDNLIKPYIKTLQAYNAKEIPCKIKLDANESPYGITIKSKDLSNIKTNRYPDPEARQLRNLVAGKWKISSEKILHGNGSDELIYYLITTFGGPVLFPVPTFSMYNIIPSIMGEKTISVPLSNGFDLDLDRMLFLIKKNNPHIIFLSSPNNPTGNSFSADSILKLLRMSKGIVVVDEAYQPFSGSKSMVSLLSDYKNLAVMRTFSKIGLAALRVGFLIAGKDIIKEVNKARLPFNLNSLSQSIAIEALHNYGVIKKSIKKIKEERKRLFKELSLIAGITTYPSDANFILFKIQKSEFVFKRLLKDGILIRNMSDVMSDCLRVTVGSHEENRLFIKSLKRIVRIKDMSSIIRRKD